MSELAKIIEDSDELWCGEGVDARKILIYKIEMKKKELPELPSEFADFLKECNGVRGSGCEIFAMNPDVPFSDILSENLRAGMGSSGGVILGYNDFDFLVYDSENREYQLRDKDGMEISASYQSWEDAAAALLPL